MGKEKERDALKQVYRSSRAWIMKVNRMDDAQVMAIYNRLKSQRKVK